MYYMRKYVNCWALHDDETGESRPLNLAEVSVVKRNIPALQDPKVRTYFFDHFPDRGLELNLSIPPAPG